MFWILSLFLSWIVWALLADKRRWREILPVSIFASWLSFVTEAWMHYVYQLWSYSETPIVPLFGNAFGIYILMPYLYIQWLPKNKTVKYMLVYIFLWAGFAIFFELVHWRLEKIIYHEWWNIGYSYISDWILFWIFYKYYSLTNLQKLGADPP